MRKRKTMQPIEEIPTATAAVEPSFREDYALDVLRQTDAALAAICAMGRRDATPKTVAAQQQQLRQLRDRVSAALAKLEKARPMERVPEGGEE
jgi:hypothetical protein